MDKCIYSEVCGGCDYQGVSYKKQLILKSDYVNKLLSRFHNVNKIIGMDDPTHYRNKVQVTFGKDDAGKIVYGNFVENSHIIVPIDNCLICDREAIDIINTIKKLIIKYRITVFDEFLYKGCIRHVLVRCSHDNKYIVVLVTGNSRVNRVNSFIKDLLNKHNNIVTIIQCINETRTSMILSNKAFVLYGDGYLIDKLCGNEFVIGYNSFYQVNKRQTEVLYDTVLKFADLKGDENVLDMYCGIGTITLALAKKCKKVTGVEINKRAIKDAINNKKINNIRNAFFVSDDSSKFMLNYIKTKEKVDLLVVDPPRSGCDKKFLNAVLKLKPKKIVYVSCNPNTLQDDLMFLTSNKHYVVSNIQPVDMFPCTKHIECVCELILNK